jgi:hypothetical protein
MHPIGKFVVLLLPFLKELFIEDGKAIECPFTSHSENEDL